MTHRSADDLSNTIDDRLSRAGSVPSGHLAEVVEALSGSLPSVGDDSARERVRRRLAGFDPNPRTVQQVLIERAVDEIERLQRRVTGEEYVPWPGVAAAIVVLAVSVGLAAWLRRRGMGQGISTT